MVAIWYELQNGANQQATDVQRSWDTFGSINVCNEIKILKLLDFKLYCNFSMILWSHVRRSPLLKQRNPQGPQAATERSSRLLACGSNTVKLHMFKSKLQIAETRTASQIARSFHFILHQNETVMIFNRLWYSVEGCWRSFTIRGIL